MSRTVTIQPGHTLAELTALLASGQFVYADCYTITPTQGAIVRFTDAQESISAVAWGTAISQTYVARSVAISGLRARSTIGPTVDEQDIEIAYDASALFQGWASWPKALLLGRLDGATISRDRVIAAAWGSPWLGVTRMFSGRVSSLDSVGRTVAHLKVKSDLELLNVKMPRDLFTPICKNTWGDSKCGINQASYAVIGTIGAGATRSVLPWSGANATYANGKITIANGDGVTRVRTILRATATTLTLIYPLDFTPAASLTFTAYPGCARTMTNCQTYHGATWMNFFGGYPFVPIAETAL